MLYNKDISKKLSKIDLDFEFDEIFFRTYWCRIVLDETKSFNKKEHSHSFYELHLCLRGESTFEWRGQE